MQFVCALFFSFVLCVLHFCAFFFTVIMIHSLFVRFPFIHCKFYAVIFVFSKFHFCCCCCYCFSAYLPFVCFIFYECSCFMLCASFHAFFPNIDFFFLFLQLHHILVDWLQHFTFNGIDIDHCKRTMNAG